MLGHKYDYTIKIILLGDSGVGKTSFLTRFTQDKWEGNSTMTTGVYFLTKEITTETHKILLQLWDTSGQEIYRSLTRSYFRNSAAALILFDLTAVDSFENVSAWVEDIKETEGTNIPLILIGNKSDLINERTVTTEEAMSFAKSNQMTYFETSAKTGQNIIETMKSCVSQIEKRIDEGLIPSNNEKTIKLEEKKCNC